MFNKIKVLIYFNMSVFSSAEIQLYMENNNKIESKAKPNQHPHLNNTLDIE